MLPTVAWQAIYCSTFLYVVDAEIARPLAYGGFLSDGVEKVVAECDGFLFPTGSWAYVR